MLFGSYTFLLYFACVLGLLKLLERLPRVQGAFLLAASFYFYAYWDVRFLFLLCLSSSVDYLVGLGLHRAQSPSVRKALVAVSVASNLSILLFFKYFDFFQQSAEMLLDRLGIGYDPWLLGVALPVGISFYTFQMVSYSIDVYRGALPACRNPVVFFTFAAYLPQLVAGPIERARDLIPKLAAPRVIGLPGIASGVLLMIWGLFKKSVVADIAGTYLVDPIFSDPQGGLDLWCGVLGFAIQIFCDFSGYTDIARGVSRCFGIELIENFRAPYLAENITDFWRRWHISLSSWFRDYLYVPLGGNRHGTARTCFNLSLTMLLCGLWHGAAAKFVLWGAYHGILLLAHRVLAGDRRAQGAVAPAPPNPWIGRLKVAGCFLLVCYGWLLFRIDNSADIARYTILLVDPVKWFAASSARPLFTVLVLAAATYAAHLVQLHASDHAWGLEELPLPAWLVGSAAGACVVLTLLLGTLGDKSPFLYFQF